MAWLARWLHVAGLQLTARGESPWAQRKLKLRNGRARVAIAYEPAGRTGLNASSGSSKDPDAAFKKGLDAAIKAEVDKIDKARRKARVLPALSNLNRLDLLRVAKQYEVTLPDPDHMTVEQLKAFLYQEDEKLSRAQDPGTTKFTLGKYRKTIITFRELSQRDPGYGEWILRESRHTNKNMDELRSFLLENGIKDQTHKEGSRRRQKSSESEAPTNSDSEEPGRPASTVKGPKQGAGSRRAASSASARSRSMPREDLKRGSPTDYSRAIGVCLGHLLSRLEAHPRANSSTAQASQVMMAQLRRIQFQTISAEMGEQAASSHEMRAWMSQDPKMDQVMELLGKF